MSIDKLIDPQVLRMLSGSNMHVTFDKNDKMATNGSNIFLPAEMSDAAGEEELNAVRGALDHETAHKKYDSMSVLKELKYKRVHGVFNLLEDTRIDRRRRLEGIGFRMNQSALYRWILKRVQNIVDSGQELRKDYIAALELMEEFAGHPHPMKHLVDNDVMDLVDKGRPFFVLATNAMEAKELIKPSYELDELWYGDPPEEPEQPQQNQSGSSSGQQGQSVGQGQGSSGSSSQGENESSTSDGNGSSRGSGEQKNDSSGKGGGSNQNQEEEEDGKGASGSEEDNEEGEEESSGGGDTDEDEDDQEGSGGEEESEDEEEDESEGEEESDSEDDDSDSEDEEEVSEVDDEDESDEEDESDDEDEEEDSGEERTSNMAGGGYGAGTPTPVLHVDEDDDGLYVLFEPPVRQMIDDCNEVYTWNPEYDTEVVAPIDHTAKDNYRTTKESIASLITGLKQLFVTSIMTETRSRFSRKRYSGKLDSRSLATLQSDVRVFKTRSPKIDLDTALYYLVDLSGSMNGPKVAMARASAILLAEVSDPLGIPFGVGGFTTNGKSVRGNYTRYEGVMHVHFKQFDESYRQIKERLGRLKVYPMEGHMPGCVCNADGDAVLWAGKMLLQRPEKRKILCVLSDGYPAYNCRIDENWFLKRVINSMRATGMEVYGMGIGHDPSPLYGDEYTLTMTNQSQFTLQFFKNFTKIIQKGMNTKKQKEV